LNSGTYFGYTDKVVHYLNDIIEKEYQLGIDDQGHCGRECQGYHVW
jgi:hypothetical protein